VYANNYNWLTNTLKNVSVGTYNLYLYGKHTDDSGYTAGGTLFDVSANGMDYGVEGTTNE